MAWNTPTVTTVGQLISSAFWNAQVQANLTYLKPIYGKKTSPVSTSGTSFAAGADILASALSFTADGTSDYLVTVCGSDWSNSVASNTLAIGVNLDGSEAGIISQVYNITGESIPLNVSGPVIAPAAGSHTLNARLWVSGGTGTIDAAAGGTTLEVPITVCVEARS